MTKIISAILTVIVKILLYIASGAIRLTKAVLVALVVWFAAAVVDLFVRKLYGKN